MAFIVTVDGPAASGKTTVSRGVAEKMGWDWISTGAFYRAIAYIAKESAIEITESGLLALIRQTPWRVVMNIDKSRVIINDSDVTSEIYKEELGSYASRVSQYPLVRQELLQHQRACALDRAGLVAEGRDCGTVVFPQADLKIFLTAESGDRALRRAREYGESVEKVASLQKKRDQQDSQRAVAPLQVPVDAFVIDTSNLTLPMVIDKVLALISQKK